MEKKKIGVVVDMDLMSMIVVTKRPNKCCKICGKMCGKIVRLEQKLVW